MPRSGTNIDQALSHKQKGVLGETIAADYLEKNGFTILDKNSFQRCGEVDLIAIRLSRYYFVEVRYRTNSATGTAIESVSRYKLLKVMSAARKWMAFNNADIELFGGVLGVCIDKINGDFVVKIVSVEV